MPPARNIVLSIMSGQMLLVGSVGAAVGDRQDPRRAGVTTYGGYR